jgi:hypothetical protein
MPCHRVDISKVWPAGGVGIVRRRSRRRRHGRKRSLRVAREGTGKVERGDVERLSAGGDAAGVTL